MGEMNRLLRGLSGAVPSEAVGRGNVDPDRLRDTIVCHGDSTIALPILTAYALANHAPRRPLYDRRDELMRLLVHEYREAHVYGPDGGFRPRT